MNSPPSWLREFAERYTAAWCSQNAASVAAFFSPTGSLQVNNAPPAVGQSEIEAVVQSFMTAFPDLVVAMDEIRLVDDGAEYHWTLTGANTGPGGTGARVKVSGLERWKIEPGGLIAQSLGQFDAADYAKQLAQR